MDQLFEVKVSVVVRAKNRKEALQFIGEQTKRITGMEKVAMVVTSDKVPAITKA